MSGTLSTTDVASGLSGLFPQYVSLMHGWVPVTVQVLTAVVLLATLRRRGRRRLLAAAGVGVVTALAAHWYIASQGLAGDPAPHSLWVWIGLTGFAAAALVSGWHRGGRSRRAVALAAVPLCALCVALAADQWTGYLPTAQTAWSQLTAGPLPDETDMATVTAFRSRHTVPRTGSVVPVDTGHAGSGFTHRGELVYLPPAWFASDPPPQLPTIMMIGGELNTPADWARAGNAIQTADTFAAAHHGNAPVLVFVDPTGGLSNDTECVDGPHGNVDTHITKEVRPAVISQFGAADQPGRWAVAGWSMGGTCAIDLTVEHPDLFRTFVDISGDVGPNLGNRAQTTSALYGGRPADWDRFDPATAMRNHGPYDGVGGWFQSEGYHHHGPGLTSPQIRATATLSEVARANNIDVVVRPRPGRHNWQFAGQALADALPWLMNRLDSSN